MRAESVKRRTQWQSWTETTEEMCWDRKKDVWKSTTDESWKELKDIQREERVNEALRAANWPPSCRRDRRVNDPHWSWPSTSPNLKPQTSLPPSLPPRCDGSCPHTHTHTLMLHPASLSPSLVVKVNVWVHQVQSLRCGNNSHFQVDLHCRWQRVQSADVLISLVLTHSHTCFKSQWCDLSTVSAATLSKCLKQIKSSCFIASFSCVTDCWFLLVVFSALGSC